MQQEAEQDRYPMGGVGAVDNVRRKDKKNKPDVDQDMDNHDLQAFIHSNHPLV
ncbi:hypothetical protein D3C76_1559660 [compost metagenome]